MENKKLLIIASIVIALLAIGGTVTYLIYSDNLSFGDDKTDDTADNKAKEIIEYADDDKNKEAEHMQTVPAGEGEEFVPVTASPVPEGLSGPSNYADTNLQ